MSHPVRSVQRLDFVWDTADPFLFCVHHDDAYPEGDARMAPKPPLAGRNMGADFSGIDGWSMYHGRTVPGFPQHPHRGFETITLVRRGLVDHSDSLGATGRFGGGDAQWMTAGGGVVHSEMFPLLNEDSGNHMEMFQIWINLPAEHKLVPAHYKMLWREDIPIVEERDAQGRRARITVVAGAYGEHVPPSPPPHSWAAREASNVAVWAIKLEPGATWQLPATLAGTHRRLYAFWGGSLDVGGVELPLKHGATLDPELPVTLTAGDGGAEALLLQGRPIGEPVARYGPFVMNTTAEIRQAMVDYQRTGFGGWPWDRDDPVHPRDAGRFARHSDGTVEEKA